MQIQSRALTIPDNDVIESSGNCYWRVKRLTVIWRLEAGGAAGEGKESKLKWPTWGRGSAGRTSLKEVFSAPNVKRKCRFTPPQVKPPLHDPNCPSCAWPPPTPCVNKSGPYLSMFFHVYSDIIQGGFICVGGGISKAL